MKTFKHLLFGVVIPIAVGVTVIYFLQQNPVKHPDAGIETYSKFDVVIDKNIIFINNAGDYELLNVSIDFIAKLDDGEYKGSRTYNTWKPGEMQSIGITTSHGSKDVNSIEFKGMAKKENKYVDLFFKNKSTVGDK